MRIQTAPRVLFQGQTAPQNLQQAEQQIRQYLQKQNAEVSNIVPLSLEGKESLEIFATPQHYDTVLEKLKAMPGMTPREEANKLQYHRFEVGVWGDVQMEPFQPG